MSRSLHTFAQFQSTPPARGATAKDNQGNLVYDISIHAPREGGDIGSWSLTPASKEFQSTPPARGATLELGCTIISFQFQSTPPARGATGLHP